MAVDVLEDWGNRPRDRILVGGDVHFEIGGAAEKGRYVAQQVQPGVLIVEHETDVLEGLFLKRHVREIAGAAPVGLAQCIDRQQGVGRRGRRRPGFLTRHDVEVALAVAERRVERKVIDVDGLRRAVVGDVACQ